MQSKTQSINQIIENLSKEVDEKNIINTSFYQREPESYVW
jgi:arginine decarboxylase-like protein